MMFSLTWLKDHLNTEASVKEIVDTLNAIGLEVEGVEDPAVRLAGFTVAKVLTAGKHQSLLFRELVRSVTTAMKSLRFPLLSAQLMKRK